ncbi:MAG: hypothetical protein US30_C0001G0091 [Candidatus Moranbacteria bacterium GW2011_GWF2_36_839]|nr:MAG: hypothetical protein US27_C0001G0091 [Candidatus Moranbacteria bacterium GW2011_GWF1_36_78]KKQ17757.1 MAG: hypothetical protein US30_C0001G0091 [Candidatus Moranbacteria bacterium GW2011_GWF2_36_839]HAT73458.1 hypothetical protein [Candidatus Moranbacteria bacterium]HBY10820.1 hypothetical protein [Candidatus Moranbacteria bacterium]
MLEIFKLKKFYIIFIFATAFVFLVLINLNRTYKSQTDILVIFKSEKSAQNANIILENITVLPKSLSFYDRVVQDEEDAQNEVMSELPDYKRKDYWNEIVEIRRVGNSSVLEFIAKDNDSYTAEVLSTQTVKTLLSIIGAYYDIKNDIDIRIIDGPITKDSFSGSYSYSLLKSLPIGFVLAFVLNYFLFLFIQDQLKEKPKASLAWSYKETLRNIEPKQPETKILKEKKPTTETEGYIPIFGKKAVAPDNLPIAEDIPVFEQPQKEEPKKEGVKTPLIHEATAEEVKERLNRLLSGKL